MSYGLRKKNEDIDSPKIKNKILQYLYSSDFCTDEKIEYLVDERDLGIIRNSEYLLCAGYRGTRSWIIIFHVDEEYYAVNFPKHGKHKQQKIIIYPINIPIAKKFYYGTIMEGIYYYDEINNSKYLYIDDVYMLFGENQLLKSKEDRLKNLSFQLKKHVTQLYNEYIIRVNQHYSFDELSLKKLYDEIKINPNIKELLFFPNNNYGKKKYSYLLSDSDRHDDVMIICNYIMVSTNNPDVYMLYNLETEEKVEIAYIPDISTSRKCKKWYEKKSKNHKLIVKCRLDNIKNKWIPDTLISDYCIGDNYPMNSE